MKQLTLEQHRARLENLRRAAREVRACTRDLRINNYLPGQIIYYLGDYPAPMSIRQPNTIIACSSLTPRTASI